MAYFTAAGTSCREAQRPTVERLQKLTSEVKQLRSKGMEACAKAQEAEIQQLKRALGIKDKPKTVREFKNNLKERLTKCR